MLCTFLVTDRSVETSRLLPAPCPRGGEGVTIESGEGLGERNAWMSIRSEHYVVSEEEAEAIWFLGTLATIKATAEQTHGALPVVEFTHPPGYRVPRTSTTRPTRPSTFSRARRRGSAATSHGEGNPDRSSGYHATGPTPTSWMATRRFVHWRSICRLDSSSSSPRPVNQRAGEHCLHRVSLTSRGSTRPPRRSASSTWPRRPIRRVVPPCRVAGGWWRHVVRSPPSTRSCRR